VRFVECIYTGIVLQEIVNRIDYEDDDRNI